MTDLHPTGPELAQRNRRIIAARVGWPPGAVDECERIERLFPLVNLIDGAWPRWSVYWSDRPRPGYYAIREHKTHGEPPAFGETPDELLAAIGDWPYPEPHAWSFEPLEPSPKRPG